MTKKSVTELVRNGPIPKRKARRNFNDFRSIGHYTPAAKRAPRKVSFLDDDSPPLCGSDGGNNRFNGTRRIGMGATMCIKCPTNGRSNGKRSSKESGHFDSQLPLRVPKDQAPVNRGHVICGCSFVSVPPPSSGAGGAAHTALQDVAASAPSMLLIVPDSDVDQKSTHVVVS